MKCCKNCRFCAELVRPYERSDGACIYGYCFSSGDKNYSPKGSRFLCHWMAEQRAKISKGTTRRGELINNDFVKRSN